MRLSMILALVAALSIALKAIQPGLAVTYLAPSTVTLNEPVLITVALQNLLRERVKIDLGWNRRVGFAVTVRAPDGRIYRPEIERGGVGRIGRISIPVNEQHVQPLVLDDWMTLDQLGDYQVEIRIVAPITSATGDIMDSPPPAIVNIHVGPRNQTILRAKCEELKQNVTDANPETKDVAIHMLGHMRDPVAIPCFRAVLDSTNVADGEIITALQRLGTLAAQRALQDIASSPGARGRMAASALVVFKRR